MRFKGFDLNLITVFNIMMDERNVSRAAERLNLSQPAVSAALSRLRDYFDDELFIPVGRRMMPTAYAETLTPLVRQVLENAEQLIDTKSGFDPAISQRRFCISASDYILTVLIAPLLQRFEAYAPGIQIETIPTGDQSSIMFENGEVDLIISPDQYLSSNHPSEKLFHERHVIIGCAANPAMQMPIDMETFLSLGHIAVKIGHGREMTFAERHLLPYRDRRRIDVTASAFSSVPWMLPNTHKIAVLHERLSHAFMQILPLRVQPLPFDMPLIEEQVQYHTARVNDAGLAWLVNEFRKVANGQNLITVI